MQNSSIVNRCSEATSQNTEQPTAGGQQQWFLQFQQLGGGLLGRVVLAQDMQLQNVVAIELVATSHLPPDLDEGDAIDILNELTARARLKHPHIVQVKEALMLGDEVGVVSEFADQGRLYEFLIAQEEHRLLEPAARWYFQQLILAVDYLHRRCRGFALKPDIRLESLLLCSSRNTGGRNIIKLGDFQLTKFSAHISSSTASPVSSMCYIAPEVARGDACSEEASDVWSCGVILYTMLVGKYPFTVDAGHMDVVAQQNQVAQKVAAGMINPIPANNLGLSMACCEFVYSLLASDPSERLNLRGIMEHPWFLMDLPQGSLQMNEDVQLRSDSHRTLQMLQWLARTMQKLMQPRGAFNAHEEPAFFMPSPPG